MTKPYDIGQSVRIVPSQSGVGNVTGDFTILRRNDLDGPEPNYVIESAIDRRQRREIHSRLAPVARAGAFRR